MIKDQDLSNIRAILAKEVPDYKSAMHIKPAVVIGAVGTGVHYMVRFLDNEDETPMTFMNKTGTTLTPRDTVYVAYPGDRLSGGFIFMRFGTEGAPPLSTPKHTVTYRHDITTETVYDMPDPLTYEYYESYAFQAASAPRRNSYNLCDYWVDQNGVQYKVSSWCTMPDHDITLTAHWYSYTPRPVQGIPVYT